MAHSGVINARPTEVGTGKAVDHKREFRLRWITLLTAYNIQGQQRYVRCDVEHTFVYFLLVIKMHRKGKNTGKPSQRDLCDILKLANK